MIQPGSSRASLPGLIAPSITATYGIAGVMVIVGGHRLPDTHVLASIVCGRVREEAKQINPPPIGLGPRVYNFVAELFAEAAT